MKVVLSFQYVFYILGAQSYYTADMNKFGKCRILIKRFEDNTKTMDTTSIVTTEQLSGKHYPIYSVYSSNKTLQVIQPILNVREECTLNVIIGYASKRYLDLYDYMLRSRYTFTSHPHSTYIIVLEYDTEPMLLDVRTLSLPTSIFVLYIRKKSISYQSLQSGPFYTYFCFSCIHTLQPVDYNNNIRLVNDDWFLNDWKINNSFILVLNTAGNGDITKCEQLMWARWLSSVDLKSIPRSGCNKPYAFWSSVFRSVNLTAHLSTSMDSSMYGYSGFFFQEFLTKDMSINPWRASSTHYHASAFSYIIYCDCDRRTEMISFHTWITCFTESVWFCLIGVVATLAAVMNGSTHMSSAKYVLNTYLMMLTDIVGIAIRQGSYNCVGLAVFSMGMFIVSTIFENTVMSTLVVPDNLAVFDITKLVQNDYKILISDVSGSKHTSYLPYLLEELNIANVAVRKDKIERNIAEIWNNPDTFIKNRSSIFGIATSNGKIFLKQRLNSITPQHCTCSEVRNLSSTFHVHSSCWHRLRDKIFYNLNIFQAAGFHIFLDWEIERVANDFVIPKDKAKNTNTVSDCFISFKNLIPPLVILGCLLILSFSVLVIEFINVSCRILITCTFRN
jgi:hypothetical protein